MSSSSAGRKAESKLFRIRTAKNAVCWKEFERSLLDGCYTNAWKPRFFYNSTRLQCQMFWYDESCKTSSKNFMNFFTHRQTCNELCITGNKHRYRDELNVDAKFQKFGQISAMLSQTNRPITKLRSKQNEKVSKILNDFKMDAKLNSMKEQQSLKLKYDQAPSFTNIIPKFSPVISVKSPYHLMATSKTNEEINNQFPPVLANIINLKAKFYPGGKKRKHSKRQLPLIKSNLTSSNVSVVSFEVSRCIEPKKVGSCHHRYPVYYYNRDRRQCEPFAYSGCGGNGNRFLSLQQCQSTCSILRKFSIPETVCFLPLSQGSNCSQQSFNNAGFRYYFSHIHDACIKFWYFGCNGNENNFYSYISCDAVCSKTTNIDFLTDEIDPSVCFYKLDRGNCISNSTTIELWAYDARSKICIPFQYTGCGGNQNRFSTNHSCNKHCHNFIQPLNVELCAHHPEWGKCNQLRYQWFYNLTTGTCEQFLWGGCESNSNRFDTFEMCQEMCEQTLEDVCFENLDRGSWCEPMSNRYYYHPQSKQCKGFHYTGCGKSRNMFSTPEECEKRCAGKDLEEVLLLINSTETNIREFNFSNANETKNKNFAKLQFETGRSTNGTKYRNVKPIEKKPVIRHEVFSSDKVSYIKTMGDWIHHEQCGGFRYNISGAETRLVSYLCLTEEDGVCQKQILSSTDGDEKCRLVKPWLKGTHLYTWFFNIDRHPHQQKQYSNESIATLIILPTNDCKNAC